MLVLGDGHHVIKDRSGCARRMLETVGRHIRAKIPVRVGVEGESCARATGPTAVRRIARSSAVRRGSAKRDSSSIGGPTDGQLEIVVAELEEGVEEVEINGLEEAPMVRACGWCSGDGRLTVRVRIHRSHAVVHGHRSSGLGAIRNVQQRWGAHGGGGRRDAVRVPREPAQCAGWAHTQDAAPLADGGEARSRPRAGQQQRDLSARRPPS